MPRPGAHEPDLSWKGFDQQTLAVAMGVADENLGRTGRNRRLRGSHGLIGHEAPKSLVLETRRQQLVGGHHTRDAFHVHRDVDLERRAVGGGRRGRRTDQRHEG
jgi:hypothetical protein